LEVFPTALKSLRANFEKLVPAAEQRFIRGQIWLIFAHCSARESDSQRSGNGGGDLVLHLEHVR
jgi:hypothetical protein